MIKVGMPFRVKMKLGVLKKSNLRGELRQVLTVAGICLVAGLLILFLLDLFSPEGTSLLWKWIDASWPYSPALAILLTLLFTLHLVLRHKGWKPHLSRIARIGAIGLSIIVATLMGLMLIEGFLYNPIKFTYLSHRIESAQSAEEERTAFRLAGRWGHVWELNRIHRHEWDHLPARVKRLEAPWVLEVEWLECWPNGRPYRVYRAVIDETNLDSFWVNDTEVQSGQLN